MTFDLELDNTAPDFQEPRHVEYVEISTHFTG